MAISTLTWKPEYTTGNESVDHQHQYFTELINRVCASLERSDDEAYRRRLLMELVKYGEFHFCSEENIAYELGLKGQPVHRDRHREMLSELNDHVEDLLAGRYTVARFADFLHNWFAGHTIYEDTAFFLQGGE
ncbi:MAG: hemerythrin domain-containing protein [Sedimenticola sp.]